MWNQGDWLGKKEKLLKKAVESPKNLTLNEFRTLLGHYDFEHRNTTGSHEIYKNNNVGETMNIQPDKSDKSKAKVFQIKQFLDKLRTHGMLED